MAFRDDTPQGRDKKTSGEEGWVYNIQRFSVQDGPGIRTTVFFKGCPLKCPWCSNPESQQIIPQLFYFENRCQGCGHCAEVCSSGATVLPGDGKPVLDRRLCRSCGICVQACPNEARDISGKKMTVKGVYEVLRRDFSYYLNSGGGVTISGGEPTQQPEFLAALLAQCQASSFHTCLDTCGFSPWEVLGDLLKKVDLVLLDNKHMDPGEHKKITGVDNRLILENTARIRELGIPVVIRVPLIPGYNDSEKNITALGRFMKELRLTRVDLLPYHRLGTSKYAALGMTYTLEETPSPCKEDLARVVKSLESFGLEVAVV